MFWPILIAVAVIYLANSLLVIRQMKNFADAYTSMRRRGRVAIGKQKNALSSGAIVMFLLDDEDRVLAGSRLTGLTVLSRFKDFPAFDGQPVAGIDARSVRMSASMRRAVINARDNFLVCQQGGEPVEPPSPLMKVINRIDARIGGRGRHPAATGTAIGSPVPASQRVVHRRGLVSTD